MVLENLNEVNNNVNNDAAPADDEVAENAPAAAHGEDVQISSEVVTIVRWQPPSVPSTQLYSTNL